MYATSTRRLAAVLLEQLNVISLAQVIAAGCDPELPAREVAAGRWRRLARRIYLAGADEPTLLQRAWCGQLIGAESSVISGALACQLGGIRDAPGLAAVVLLPAERRRRGVDDGFVTRRTSRLPDWVDMDGVRVANAARAVVDACRESTALRDVRAVVCGALNGKHTTYEELVTERAAEPRAGLGLLGHALEDWADGVRSAPEAEVADVLRDEVRRGHMPPFLLNPMVYDGAVLLGSPDVYVPGCSLGAETDSVRHHGNTKDLDATLTRHVDFTRAALHLEHVTPTRLRQSPRAWAALFSAIAHERRGLGDPAGLRIEPIGPLQPVPGRRRRR